MFASCALRWLRPCAPSLSEPPIWLAKRMSFRSWALSKAWRAAGWGGVVVIEIVTCWSRSKRQLALQFSLVGESGRPDCDRVIARPPASQPASQPAASPEKSVRAASCAAGVPQIVWRWWNPKTGIQPRRVHPAASPWRVLCSVRPLPNGSASLVVGLWNRRTNRVGQSCHMLARYGRRSQSNGFGSAFSGETPSTVVVKRRDFFRGPGAPRRREIIT